MAESSNIPQGREGYAAFLRRKSQIDGEDLSGEDLGSLASAWAQARKQNAIGALSRQVEFREYKQNPQEVISEQRKYQALEMARLCNIPAYLVSAPTEGASMTYQNAQQARQDLYLFGARIYLDCIEQTLSADNILPRGRYVEFDIDDYMEENMNDTATKRIDEVSYD